MFPDQATNIQPDLALFALIGFLGGAHCIAMCGPLIKLYTDNIRSHQRNPRHLTLLEVRQHSLFNIGRTISYASIGAIFGGAGWLLFTGTNKAINIDTAIRAPIGILVGAMIMAFGVYYLTGYLSTIQVTTTPVFGAAFRWIHNKVTKHVNNLTEGPSIVALGTTHSLLPCPILYPAYLYAFTTASPIKGAAALTLLGLGTIPAVFAFGAITQATSHRLQGGMHRALGAVFIILGYISLSHGLLLLGYDVPHIEVPIYQPLGGGHAG